VTRVAGTGPAAGPSRRGPLFWSSAVAGWALILWGVRGALHHQVDTRPGQLVRFLLGGALAHDLVLAPVVLLTGVVLARTVGGRWRAPVQSALLVSGTLFLFSYPLLRGYGRALGNPTSLPHNYAANLAVVLGAVAAVTAAVAVAAARGSVSASRRAAGGEPASGRRRGTSSSGRPRHPTP